MESFLQCPIGAQFFHDLLLTEVTEVMCASRQTRKAGLGFSGVVAFATSRPRSDRPHFQRSMPWSLREWSDLFQDYIQATKDANWSGQELILGLSRIIWSPDESPITHAIAVDALPPQGIFESSRCLTKCGWIVCATFASSTSIRLPAVKEICYFIGM